MLPSNVEQSGKIYIYNCRLEDVAEEDGILELDTPSSQILEEMAYDRSEMMNNVE